MIHFSEIHATENDLGHGNNNPIFILCNHRLAIRIITGSLNSREEQNMHRY